MGCDRGEPARAGCELCLSEDFWQLEPKALTGSIVTRFTSETREVSVGVEVGILGNEWEAIGGTCG